MPTWDWEEAPLPSGDRSPQPPRSWVNSLNDGRMDASQLFKSIKLIVSRINKTKRSQFPAVNDNERDLRAEGDGGALYGIAAPRAT